MNDDELIEALKRNDNECIGTYAAERIQELIEELSILKQVLTEIDDGLNRRQPVRELNDEF